MNLKRGCDAFLILTMVFGVGIVVCGFDVSSLLVIVWIGILVSRVRRPRRSAGCQVAWMTGILHAGVMILMIALAFFVPVKQREAMLRRPVQLTATTMTVAQLADEYLEHRKSFPLRIELPLQGLIAERTLHFSSTRLPLQQFIAEVEEQAGCKHRLTAGCGNATSILYGSIFNQLSFVPRTESDRSPD